MNQINGIGEVHWMGTACGKVTITKKGAMVIFSTKQTEFHVELNLNFGKIFF